MTPRENILSLFRRQGYEYTPAHFLLCPSQAEKFQEKTGSSDYFEYFNFPWRYSPAPAHSNTDIDWKPYYKEPLAIGTVFDKWGVAHEPGGEAAMHMTRMKHSMAEFSSLEQFQAYPYPEHSTDFSNIKNAVDDIHGRGLAVMAGGGSIWETSWYMRSMEQLMMDMMSDETLAAYHLDRVTEQICRITEAVVSAGVDIVHYGDDVGMQKSLMMSAEMYREWIKPRFNKVIETARKINPDVIISYHTCGFVTPLIDDFIEAGIDVLNPVQPECMDFKDIHAEFGDRISFWGTIGTQTTMPFGTPSDVKEAVHRNLKIAGPQGGLLCSPTHLVEPEVPWENILAYIEACKTFKL